MIKLIRGDCLKLMPEIESGSVDMVLCDLPYGITACKWDQIIPFDKLWPEYKRICRPNAAIVLFGNQPFTSVMINSNIKAFKQELIWSKGKGSNPLLARKRPMMSHENILVFCYGKLPYFPQMRKGKPYKAPKTGGMHSSEAFNQEPRKNTKTYGNQYPYTQSDNEGFRYPLSVVNYSIHCGSKKHPTEKPTELLRYLIRTYTEKGATILDNTMGSGSTGVAAKIEERSFIGIEQEEKYYEIASQRINEASCQQMTVAQLPPICRI